MRRAPLLLSTLALVVSAMPAAGQSPAPLFDPGSLETYCVTVSNPSLASVVDPAAFTAALADGSLAVVSVAPCEPDTSLEPEASPSPAAGAPALVPLGSWVTIGDWRVRITKVDPDAWPRIKKANSFNDAPPRGYTDVMAFVQYEYQGTGREQLGLAYGMRAVGDSGFEYSTFDDPSCGVLPKPAADDSQTLRNGGRAEGWICWTVKDEDVASLRAFTDLFLDDTYQEFALR